MQTTHAIVGMTIAAPIAALSPELAGIVLLAGLVGGAIPDLDLYKGHRRTLHFPVGYPVAAGIMAVTAVVAPTPASIALTVFLAAAAAHCLMDVFGGGLELRPWEGRSDRAVYDHVRNRWIAPRRWIRYDGSPEDLGIATAATLPVLFVADGQIATIAATLLGISAVYVVVRRRLPDLAAMIAARVPPAARKWVPERYFE
ncbi:metal-dependent hydrolase [Halopenitus sp. H-Gu1]|uniref:metal-dependent hydrolase n=1 Tax=Halopenitus sp. H-Gu1 TaxID=3242697 RepID=UPI00359EBF68